MSFLHYPTYKDSGVPWLGQVPVHWDVLALKRHFDVTLGKMVTKEGDEDDRAIFPYLRSANVQAGRVSLDDVKRMWLASEERKALDLRAGDLVVCEGGDVGRCALLERDLPGFGFQNSVLRIRSIGQADNRVLAYWLKLLKDNGFIDVLCNKATIAHFTADKVRNLPVAVPPAPEQRLIAEFLDRETGKLDSLVAEQEALLALLAEKRQAIISDAVTRGLDPSVRIKDSGLEWLGLVPSHWKFGKLGYGFKLGGGFAFSSAYFGPEGVAVVRMNNLKRGHLDLSGATCIPENICMPAFALRDGDLVWGMSGSIGETGSLGNFARVFLADLPCQQNQRVGRFIGNESRLTLDFLEYIIQARLFTEQILVMVNNTAQYNVSSEQVQSCIIAFPPIIEQRSIVDYIRTEVAKCDDLSAESLRSIALLRERRASLISAAVTGQMDLRGTVLASRHERDAA